MSQTNRNPFLIGNSFSLRLTRPLNEKLTAPTPLGCREKMDLSMERFLDCSFTFPRTRLPHSPP